ncbi:hypothetical protein JCM11251_002249 [Rhodosporidiobolus azoricus]
MPCTLYCTGSNSHGQLATASTDDFHSFFQLILPDTSSRPLDLACGANHTLLLVEDGSTRKRRLHGAGSNARGQLYPASPAVDTLLSFQPLDVLPPGATSHGGFEPIAVAACWETSFVVFRPGPPSKQDDLLVAFGANDWGELGYGSAGGSTESAETSVRFDHLKESVEEVVRVEKIRAGPRHVVALLSFSRPSPPSNTATTSSLPPAPPSLCRRLLVGWGASRHGQLGPSSSSFPLPKATPLPTAVTLPPNYDASEILDFAVGKDHSAVVLSAKDQGEGGQRVWLFGTRRLGQLGPFPPEVPSAEDIAARRRKATDVAATSNILSASSLLEGLSPSPAGSPPIPVASYEISCIGCTWNGTYVVLSPSPDFSPSPSSSSQPDVLLSFGSHTHGQLGCGAPSTISGASHAPAPARPALEFSSSAGQPRLVALPSLLSSNGDNAPLRISHLACGSEHVLVVFRHRLAASISTSSLASTAETEGGGEVWGWGWNEHGNLTLSDRAERRGEKVEAGEEAGEAGVGLEDVWEPRRVWSSRAGNEVGRGKVEGIWAGMATSWVSVEEEEEEEGE